MTFWTYYINFFLYNEQKAYRTFSFGELVLNILTNIYRNRTDLLDSGKESRKEKSYYFSGGNFLCGPLAIATKKNYFFAASLNSCDFY